MAFFQFSVSNKVLVIIITLFMIFNLTFLPKSVKGPQKNNNSAILIQV